jgi:hypothetical protein
MDFDVLETAVLKKIALLENDKKGWGNKYARKDSKKKYTII